MVLKGSELLSAVNGFHHAMASRVFAECDEKAFEHRLRGEIDKHDERVHAVMDRMAEQVDVLVLGQISLA